MAEKKTADMPVKDIRETVDPKGNEAIKRAKEETKTKLSQKEIALFKSRKIEILDDGKQTSRKERIKSNIMKLK